MSELELLHERGGVGCCGEGIAEVLFLASIALILHCDGKVIPGKMKEVFVCGGCVVVVWSLMLGFV